MTTLLSAHTEPTAPVRFRLVRAEIMKIRTTNTWWLFLIGIFVVTALALTVNGFGHHFDLYPPPGERGDGGQDLAAQAAYYRTHAGLAKIAADMMTSGQFFGSLFAMLIGDPGHHQRVLPPDRHRDVHDQPAPDRGHPRQTRRGDGVRACCSGSCPRSLT